MSRDESAEAVGQMTLEGLAENRRARDLPTHVHVVGDFDADPPKGLETAKRAAALIVEENGIVKEDDYAELDDGDVAFVRIDEPPGESYEERERLRNLAHVSRVKMLAGIVVFTESVSSQVEELLDARVWAESGGVDRVDRIQVNAFDRGVYAIEMEWS